METLIALLLSSVLLAGASADGSPAAGGAEAAPGGSGEDPVYIDATDILYLESFPVQFSARGMAHDACEQARSTAQGLAYVANVRECTRIEPSTDGDEPVSSPPRGSATWLLHGVLARNATKNETDDLSQKGQYPAKDVEPE